MNCTNCFKMNLPGGVRCIYCGASLPPMLEFDLSSESAAGSAPSGSASVEAEPGAKKPAASPASWTSRILGPLAVLALKGKALLGLLKFGKILTTLSSMLLFIWADALLFGWKFGVGIAVCIFVHEMGHVIVNWRKGLKQTAPMFIPFVGAVIFIKQFPNDPTIESESGAGGPVAGMLAALVCLLIANALHSPFWMALANLGFLINLFNLIPFLQLDGAHISAVFSPRTWDAVLIAMLLWVLKVPSLMLGFILVVGFLTRLGLKSDGRYLLATPATRIRMACIYLALCLGLAYGAEHTGRSNPIFQSSRARAALPPRSAQTTQHRRSLFSTTTTTGRSALLQPRLITSAVMEVVRWTIRLTLLSSAVLLWLLTSYLLTVASGRRFGGRNFALVGWMCGAGVALYLLFFKLDLFAQSRLGVLGAYFAAALAGLCFAGYQAAHRSGKRIRPSLPALTASCLAWAAGAALVVAYALNDLTVAGIVVLCGVIFYARSPWLLASLAGTLCQQMGAPERAIAYRRRALALKPDAESCVRLWTEIAVLNQSLACGRPMLEALDAIERQTALQQSPETAPASSNIATLSLRAAALTYLDRYEEAVAYCEQMLQAPQSDLLNSRRLQLVHIRLAEMAQYRGWLDEMEAQVEWTLRIRPGLPPARKARLHAMRAVVLTAQERSEEARKECDLALKASRDPLVEAWCANVRALICLAANDAAGAERETAFAMRRLPGNLEVRYWRGQALLACGGKQEGAAILTALGKDHPQEHWGKLARAWSESSAASDASIDLSGCVRV